MDSFDQEFLEVISSMCGPDDGESGVPPIADDIESFLDAPDDGPPLMSDSRAPPPPSLTSSSIDGDDLSNACAFIKEESLFLDSLDGPEFLSFPDGLDPLLTMSRRKRSRTDDDEAADASRISIETAIHLKKLNIDPESKEGKAEKRKIQNRMSAQMHRERKRVYIETLESQLQEREKSLHDLLLYTKYLMNTLDNLGCSYERRNLFDSIKPRVSFPSASSSAASLAGGTSSESDSDESSQHSTKRSSSQKPLTAGLTLFSFMFFIYMAFMPSPRVDSPATDSLVPVPSGRIISDLSAGQNPYHSQLHNQLGEYRPHISISAPSSAAVADHRYLPPEHAPILGNVPLKDTKLSSTSSNRSLWMDEEHVAHLYPHIATDNYHNSMNVPPASHSLRGSVPTNRQKLVYDRALSINTPGAYSRPYSRSADASFQEPEISGPSIDWSVSSQAVMLDGRVLLDPILLSAWDPRTYSPSKAVILNTGSHGPRKVIAGLLPAGSSSRPDVGPDMYGSRFETNHGPRDEPHTQHHSDSKSVVPLPGPLLTMLLPASSVRWTSVWAADASPEDYDLLRTVLGARYHDEHAQSANSSDYWIEIGCSIIKARVVKNITHI